MTAYKPSASSSFSLFLHKNYRCSFTSAPQPASLPSAPPPQLGPPCRKPAQAGHHTHLGKTNICIDLLKIYENLVLQECSTVANKFVNVPIYQTFRFKSDSEVSSVQGLQEVPKLPCALSECKPLNFFRNVQLDDWAQIKAKKSDVPPRMDLKPLMVSFRGTSLPK